MHLVHPAPEHKASFHSCHPTSYLNPTLQLLAARISSLVYEREGPQLADRNQQHVAKMNAMIMKYPIGLPEPAALPAAGRITNGIFSHSSGAVMLITGSTGGLRSFLLSSLLRNPRLEKVYALNRPSSSTVAERQRASFVDKGLSVDVLGSEKLVYVEADACLDKCGLSSELYDEVWVSSIINVFLALIIDTSRSVTL
jgi:hypothetical protein